jgi:hypothetical protein
MSQNLQISTKKSEFAGVCNEKMAISSERVDRF